MTNIFFPLFLVVGGIYLLSSGVIRLFSKKHFLKGEQMPGVDIDKEYERISKGDRISERFIMNIGSIILGLGLIGAGIYSLVINM